MGITPAKLCLSYCINKNTLPIVKSLKKDRMKENLDIDYKIDKADLEILDLVHNKDLDRPLRS
jgi:diketogulonate reductase-like aldo/keto reductase